MDLQQGVSGDDPQWLHYGLWRTAIYVRGRWSWVMSCQNRKSVCWLARWIFAVTWALDDVQLLGDQLRSRKEKSWLENFSSMSTRHKCGNWHLKSPSLSEILQMDFFATKASLDLTENARTEEIRSLARLGWNQDGQGRRLLRSWIQPLVDLKWFESARTSFRSLWTTLNGAILTDSLQRGLWHWTLSESGFGKINWRSLCS